MNTEKMTDSPEWLDAVLADEELSVELVTIVFLDELLSHSASAILPKFVHMPDGKTIDEETTFYLLRQYFRAPEGVFGKDIVRTRGEHLDLKKWMSDPNYVCDWGVLPIFSYLVMTSISKEEIDLSIAETQLRAIRDRMKAHLFNRFFPIDTSLQDVSKVRGKCRAAALESLPGK